MPSHRNPQHRGFTLIELLVVIAIIAILAAILFPVFSQARDKGRATACLTHARQIGTATQMYSQDYDEYLIPANTGQFPNMATYTGWDRILTPYVKSAGVFTCPSAGAPAGQTLSIGTNKHVSSMLYFTNLSPKTWKMTDVEYPAECILMHDSPPQLPNSYNGGLNLGNPYGACLGYLHSIGVTGAYSPNVQQYLRHQVGANYVFCDGHAKWSKPERTFTPYNLWFPDRPAFTLSARTLAGCSALNRSL
jgi:prepilin-type N-terminal cleavage/methylation domain-containing protein/prepilin-type processing-associated H-X9-DG protein